MARETWVQSQVESYQRLKKWYLMPPCLTLSIIRYGSRGKVEQSREGVAPYPTPWCSSYRKGSLRVTLDYGRQLFIYIYIYIYILYIYVCVCVCVFGEVGRKKIGRKKDKDRERQMEKQKSVMDRVIDR